MLVPVQPHGHDQVHQLLRHRQQVLAASSVSYDNEEARRHARRHQDWRRCDPELLRQGPVRGRRQAKDAEFKKAVADTLKADGYPAKADPAKMNKVMMVVILTYLVILVTMVYGPIAAMLVELFPRVSATPR